MFISSCIPLLTRNFRQAQLQIIITP